MEQLLFESDKSGAEQYAQQIFPLPINHDLPHTLNNEYYNKYSKQAFEIACAYKNHQMQEFDKWKSLNGWNYTPFTACYVRIDIEKQKSGEYTSLEECLIKISFSELFEEFLKETSK